MDQGRGERGQERRNRRPRHRLGHAQRNEAQRIGRLFRIAGERSQDPRRRGQHDDDVGRGALKALHDQMNSIFLIS